MENHKLELEIMNGMRKRMQLYIKRNIGHIKENRVQTIIIEYETYSRKKQ